MRFSLRCDMRALVRSCLVRGRSQRGAEGSRGARISGMYSLRTRTKEPPMEQRTGFRAFVERHDALFTTAGALIVFLGFL